MRYLFFLLALPALAVTNIPVVVTGTTNTQAVLQYTAPDTNACTVASVPVNTGLLPEVYDLDASLYTNANLDSKTGDYASGLVRTVLIGHRTAAIALDGNTYSLALGASSQYTFTISCDSGTYVGTGGFTTGTLLVGNTAPDQADYDSTNTDFGSWLYPTIHYDTLTPTYIDPHSGAIMKRVSGPGESGAGVNPQCLPNVVDLAGVWTTPSNIDCAGDTAYASYAGSAGASAALFLWTSSPGQSGGYGINGPSFLPYSWETADDWQISLKGYSSAGAASVNTCLSYDYGATCVGATLTTVMTTSPGPVSMPSSSTYPSPYFHDWSDAPVHNDMLTNAFGGTLASVSGHNVTWGSNPDPRGSGYSVYFPVTILKPGMKILISGQTSPCPVACTVATVIDETHLTTVESLVSGTGESYSFPNWGFKVWKTGTGTLFLDSAVSSYANSASFFTGYEGGGTPFCSTSTVTVSYAANGTTAITPVQGYTCLIQSSFATLNYFLFIPSTGEARWISQMQDVSGNALSVLQNLSIPTQMFAYNTGTHHIQQCVYDPSSAHWATYTLYSPSLNPALTCSNVNPTPDDVVSEISAAYPNIDQTYFGTPLWDTTHNVLSCPSGITVSPCLFKFQLRPSQGALSWFCDIDVALTPGAAQVVNCHNSWDTYPVRWMGLHEAEAYDGVIGGVNYSSMGPVAPLQSIGFKGIEQWQVHITTIYNNSGSTALTNTFVDPSACQPIVTASGGGPIPSYLANQIPTISGNVGGASHDCIRINVPNEPAAIAPNSGDLVPLGSLPVGSRPAPCSFNSSWSCLQTAQPGDYLADPAEGNAGEKFLLLYKATLGGSSGYDLILARGLNPWYCRFYPALYGYTAHLSAWTPFEYPPNSCGALAFVLPSASPTSLAVADNPSLIVAHVTGKTTSAGYNYQWLPYTASLAIVPDLGAYATNYGIRGGLFPAVVGQGVSYGTQMSDGFAAPGQKLDFTQLFYCCIQSHPDGGGYVGSTREQVWGADGRALGGTGGGVPYIFTQVPALVSSYTSVYKLTAPTSGVGQPVLNNGGNWYANLARKLHGQGAFSGFHLLNDISGPGSSITNSSNWDYCVADVSAGECVPTSVKGDLYVSVPSASTSGNCNLDGTVNWLCIASIPQMAAAFTQYDMTTSEWYGTRQRTLTSLLNGPGRTDNYANIHSLATGDWLMGVVKWGDGKRSDMFAVQSPPWPNYDSVSRNQYVQVPVQMTGGTGVTVRVRFGYSPSLFCSTRQEQCTTAVPTSNSDPFVWASETQQWANCLTTCTVNIPAIAGRVLYYTIDTKIGSGTSSVSMPPLVVN